MVALSASRWAQFKLCPKSYEYTYLNPDTKRAWNDHGDKSGGVEQHSAAEAYLRDDSILLPPWPDKFRNLLADLKAEGARAEVEFAFRDDWMPCDWFAKDAAFRMKLDAYHTSRYVDYKTGKVKTSGWRDQLELGAMAIMLTHSAVRAVPAELWYVKHDHITRDRIHRWELEDLKAKWVRNYLILNVGGDPGLSTIPFSKTPSGFCKVCTYNISNGGPCDGSPEAKVVA